MSQTTVFKIRICLPHALQVLANVGREIEIETEEKNLGAVFDALEKNFPVLRGTTRDSQTLKRRAMVRIFVTEEDWSFAPWDTALPDAVCDGREPVLVVGAIAGG